MKKISIILIIGVLAFGVGCNDFLDEDLSGKVLGGAVLKSQDGLEAALTGTYKGLGTTWGSGFFSGGGIAATMGGDDLTTNKASNKLEFRLIDKFEETASNSRMSVLYSGLYKTIQGANNIINHYQSTEGDPETIKTIAGEAYFLRGFSYLWLTRLYGSIPLMTSAEFSEDQLSIDKAPPETIYKLIENDLKKAADMLPDQRREVGRPNKGSAQSFLALAYLTQGGWPIKDQSKYDSAATVAKEVIDHHDDYGFKFMSSYANIFKNESTTGTAEDVLN